MSVPIYQGGWQVRAWTPTPSFLAPAYTYAFDTSDEEGDQMAYDYCIVGKGVHLADLFNDSNIHARAVFRSNEGGRVHAMTNRVLNHLRGYSADDLRAFSEKVIILLVYYDYSHARTPRDTVALIPHSAVEHIDGPVTVIYGSSNHTPGWGTTVELVVEEFFDGKWCSYEPQEEQMDLEPDEVEDPEPEEGEPAIDDNALPF